MIELIDVRQGRRERTRRVFVDMMGNEEQNESYDEKGRGMYVDWPSGVLTLETKEM